MIEVHGYALISHHTLHTTECSVDNNFILSLLILTIFFSQFILKKLFAYFMVAQKNIYFKFSNNF